MSSPESAYQQPDGEAEVVMEVRRSRFVTRIGQAGSREEAMAFISDCQQRYPDARHLCWAFVAGNPSSGAEMACHDAGEPAGTAGRPMLSVLEHKGLGDVVAVVIRYFGGIKLGAGGLVRAYGAAVQQALDELPLRWRLPMGRLDLRFGFEHEDLVRRLAERFDAGILEIDYGQTVRMQLRLPREQLTRLERQLREASRGQIEYRRVEERE